jgi:hypothetical protein
MTISIRDIKKWTIDIFSEKSTYFGVYTPDDAPTPRKIPFLNNVFYILNQIQFSSKFQFYIEITQAFDTIVNVQPTEFDTLNNGTRVFKTHVQIGKIDIKPDNNKIDCSIVMDSIKDAVFDNPTITINDSKIQEYIQKRLVIRKIPETGTLDDYKQFLNTADPTYQLTVDHPEDYTTTELTSHLTTHYAYSTNPADVGKVRVGPFVNAIAKIHKKKTYIDLSFTKKGNTIRDIQAEIYYYDTQANTNT